MPIAEPSKEAVEILSATLKPCPFCGSPCELEWTPVPNFSSRSAEPDSISWHVRCMSVGTRCPMGNHWLCSTAGTAVAEWNRRKP